MSIRIARRFSLVSVAVSAVVVGAIAEARAQGDSERDQPVDDGYCDYVEGVASSERALLLAPVLFGSFGYVDQLGVAASPGASRDDLRLTAGISLSLNSVYRGRLLRQRAEALCQRHRALAATSRDSTFRALEARITVLSASMKEAEARLSRSVTDFEGRRATRQEVITTRLRVEKLRELVAASRRQLATMPPPRGDTDMADALTKYYAAEERIEDREAALRSAAGWDLRLRAGYDQFLENDDSSPYFAVVSARLNLGWLFQGFGDRRAAEGRRRLAHSDGGVGGVEANRVRLTSLLRTERKRAQENRLLVRDLEVQLAALRRMRGAAGERLESTVWFALVEARAEQAYLDAHVESLVAILGLGK